MKSIIASALAFCLVGFASAAPATTTTSPAPAKTPFAYLNQQFVFNAAAATYTFSIPLDGQSHATNVSTLNVDHIRTPGYNALNLCTFYGPGNKVLFQPPLRQESPGVIVVGPPQPIAAIQCAPTANQCLPNYADCEYSSPTTGLIVGNCCSGLCVATKCRPKP